MLSEETSPWMFFHDEGKVFSPPSSPSKTTPHGLTAAFMTPPPPYMQPQSYNGVRVIGLENSPERV